MDNLIGYLVDETYQDYLLDIMYSIANQAPIALEPYLCIFEKFTFYDSFKIDKILSTVGKSLKSKAEYCTDLLIQRIRSSRHHSRCIKVNRLSSCNPHKRQSARINANGTIVGSTETLEEEVYISGRSQKTNSFRKSNSYSYTDADTRLSRDYENKRSLQILGEIYVIASVHPQVLEVFFYQIFELFSNPSENVRLMIEKLKELQSTSSMCSSFHYDEGNSNMADSEVNNKKTSFEHSLDSIEVNNNSNTNSAEPDFASLHIVEAADLTDAKIQELTSQNFVVSNSRR